jgi:hypothetical protein
MEEALLYLVVFLLGLIIGGVGVLTIVTSRPRFF